MKTPWSRREWLTTAPAALAAGTLVTSTAGAAATAERTAAEPFGYSLNTSTIMGQKLGIVERVEIAAKAGYNGIEPWVRELDDHVKAGGSLKDLRNRIRDSGLKVESSIGFFDWVVDDEGRRKKGFEEARRNMDLVQRIGGKRLAAPPVGATDTEVNLHRAAERYRALLDLGDRLGVVPEAELWGFSRTLGRLGDAVLVAIESNHPKACFLPDVFHLYKGGSDFNGFRLLSGSSFHVIHFNDYPAKPGRAKVTDAQRVYPGDGVAPLKALLRELRRIGFRGMLSLELFNRDYWNQDALVVARTGLEKMRKLVRSTAGGG